MVIRFVLAGIDAPDELVERATRAAKRVSPKVLAFRVRQTLSIDCQDRLRNVSVPILYLQAKRDALVGPTSLKRILKIRPDVVVRRFPTYHMILQTAPRQAWQEIEAFLDEHAV